jgi:hypothetical protein
MNDLIKRLQGKYSVGPNGVYEDRDFGTYTPAINLEAVERIQELEEENEMLKRKYSEFSDFDLQIRLGALTDLMKAFTYKGHFKNSIQPEELDAYIVKLTNNKE